MAVDPVLTTLVELANEWDEPVEDGTTLTVCVQGIVIAGRLISSWQWFVEQRDLVPLMGLVGDRQRQEAGELAGARAVAPPDWSEDEREVYEAHKASWLHLNRAIVFQPGIPLQSRHFRCLLDRIDAWAFGVPGIVGLDG
jgi:hypothetical protein